MPSIGDTLRDARMRKGLDIGDLEAQTKIRAKYLRALEAEQFSELPGPTFVRTFLRTYAEALGLDPHVLVEAYRTSHDPGTELDHLQPIGPPGKAREPRRRGPPRAAVLLGLVVVAVLALLLVLGLTGEEDGEPERASTTETSTRTAAEPPAPKKAKKKPRPKPAPTSVRLRIVPTATTYACIDAGPGTPVIYEGTLDGPRSFGGKRLRVNLGNTSVALRVNGKRVRVEPGTSPVGFDFSPRRTTSLPSGQRPCA
ncbi:MAG TPA: helix-turn-helix transcriptional regulator [Thermoleophilaceae bacterium]|nr:helix-turn-helix transcriptional regulator [Thermoleophilaceae bacterium]